MHKSVLSLVCCLFFFLSCQEEIETMPNGSLNIVLTDEAAVTRTLPEALSDELRQQFTIELLRDREGTIVPEYKGALKDFGDQRVFKVGSYQLKAYLGENPSLALDAPYYYGEVQDIAIEKGKATTVTVGCKVANALATFEIVNQEDFEVRLKNYYVAITVGDRTVTWKPGDTTHPYFRAGGRVALSLVATSTETGMESSYALTPIETVEAGIKYNYKLSMKVSPDAGSIFDIITDAQQKPITVNETVPEQWLPKPKITAEGFDETNVLTYTETADAAPAIISYQAARAIQDIEFTLNFADENLSSLNKTYTLSTLSSEDKQALNAALITLPEKNTTTGSFDFTQLTAGLLTQNGGQEVENQIKVKVMANGRWSEEATYLIKTVKPEFKVAVRDGNIWTKEFTIDECTITTGNEQKIRSNLKYQYSVDGANWVDCGLVTKFEECPVSKRYQVRALYRDNISTDIVSFSLESPEKLPNNQLEEWYWYEIPGKGGLTGTNIPTYYPWKEGGNSFWNTNNDYTTRYRSKGSVATYNCFPAVSYTSHGREGMAAELRNVASGSGNTINPFNSKPVVNYDYNKVPGMLFLGEFDSANGVISSKGKAFGNRPTKLEFYYTYQSLTGYEDAFDVTIGWIDNEGKVIIESTKEFSGDVANYQLGSVELPLKETEYYSKSVKLYILFRSSKYSGGNLPWVYNASVYTEGYDKTFTTWSGSVLRIDDISLIYDK